MQGWPLAAHALHVECATVDFKAVSSVGGIQRCGSDAEARPNRYAWSLVVQLGLQRHYTVALEVMTPEHTPQMVRRMLFLLAFLHTFLWPGAGAVQGQKPERVIGLAILLQWAWVPI